MIQHVVYGEPLDTEDLSGTLTLRVSEAHADWWTKDLLALLIEQDLGPGIRYATWAGANRTMMADPRAMHAVAQDAVNRLRPWREPDQRGWPDTFEPFRSLVVLGGLLGSAHRRLVRTWEWIRWDWWTDRYREDR